MLTTILGLSEIVLIAVAGFVLLSRARFSFAAAATFAILMTLAILSLIVQFAFLIGQPNISPGIEVVMSVAALGLIVAGRDHVRTGWQTARQFISAHPIFTAFLGIVWIYLRLQAVILPPANYDSMTYNLARVLLFEQDGTLFPGSFTTARQIMHPVGSDILAHHAGGLPVLCIGLDYCDTVAEANPTYVLWKAAPRSDIPRGALLSLEGWSVMKSP